MKKLSCRSCGSFDLHEVLGLGRVPLANSLLEGDELDLAEETYTLDVVFCSSCALVQLTESIDPAVLFSSYVYFSSFSDAMLAHAHDLCADLMEQRALGARSLVVEIASNDGYLLKNYLRHGIQVLGIEPAANVAEKAIREHSVPTLVRFFDEELAIEMKADGQLADLVHAHNVFAHVPDPNRFAAGLKLILKDTGLGVIEVPYLCDLIENLEFDTIYHEHYSYYSLHAVENLLRRHGLAVTDVEHVPIHGGTLRIYVAHEGSAVSARVEEMLRHEEALGVCSPAYYQNFGARVWKLKENLISLLDDLLRQGKKIAAYGASAKGSTLMNAFGVGQKEIQFVVDRSTVKQGRYTPGNRLPILAPKALMDKRPDYVLLLTWNFAEEILVQQKEFLAAGGHFIIPIPEVRIL